MNESRNARVWVVSGADSALGMICVWVLYGVVTRSFDLRVAIVCALGWMMLVACISPSSHTSRLHDRISTTSTWSGRVRIQCAMDFPLTMDQWNTQLRAGTFGRHYVGHLLPIAAVYHDWISRIHDLGCCLIEIESLLDAQPHSSERQSWTTLSTLARSEQLLLMRAVQFPSTHPDFYAQRHLFYLNSIASRQPLIPSLSLSIC